jgi:competence protein ComEC
VEFLKTQKTLSACLIFIFAAAGALMGCPYLFLVSTLFFLLFALHKGFFSYKFVLVAVLIFCFSFFYTYYKIPKPDELYDAAPFKTVMQGRIVSFPKQNEDRTKFEFLSDYKIINNQKNFVKTKTLVSIYGKQDKLKNLQIGDRIAVSGFVKRPFKISNPAQFDYGSYLKNSGICTITYVKKNDYSLLEKPKSGKWFLIQQSEEIREKILSIHKKFLDETKLEIMGGIVFGNTAINPSQEIKNNFINSGLYHLLAASGMNVGFVFTLWYFICKKLSMPSRFSIISGGILVILYSIMTGLPPSVLRAAGTLEFILLGKLIDKESDNIVLLALVCVILLIYNPLFLKDIGFQLSFLVTFGLLLCIPPILEKAKNLPVWLTGSLAIPVVAQVWAAPIQIFHFNTFAFYSVIANVLVMPFNAIITFAGFIGSILSLIPVVGVPLCGFADKIAEPFIALLLWVTEYFAHKPNALLYFGKPLIIQIAVFYLVVVGFTFMLKMNFKQKKINLVTGVLVLVLLFFPVNKSFSKDLNLVFFNVGEGDSILVQTPDHKNILVDTGTRKKHGTGTAKTAIIPYLQDEGIKKLDGLVLTHPDSDHVGGTVDILENIKVDKIYSNGDKSDTDTYKDIETEIANKHLAVTVLKNGDEIDVDKKLKITALIPVNTNNDVFNDTSVILVLRYKEFSTILMADNETNSFKVLEPNLNEDIDLIKVGHHCSKKSLNIAMLDVLKPKVAVISVGKNNYGHPDTEILQLLKQYRVKTFRTDDDNSIKVKTNGKIFKIYSFDSDIKKWKNVVRQKAY